MKGESARSAVKVSEPRLPESLVDATHAELQPRDEWQNERVDSADLAGLDADHVEITGCTLRGVRLTGSRLEQLRLIDVLAVDCELSGAIITEATLWRVEFRNCRMSGLVMSDTKLRDVRFAECKLDDANFRFIKGERVVFDGCALVEADFSEAVLTASVFSVCDLRRGVFTKSSVAGTRLSGSTVDGLIGASALRGAIVGTEQVLPLALGVFGDLGIVISNDDGPGDATEPRVR